MIPIANIYYLLIYAWDCLDEAEAVGVDASGSTSLLDLFARVLNAGVEHLIRRGLDRDYIAHREQIAGVRGRIAFGDSISGLGLACGRPVCEFDELSHDVIHNQIIKSTLGRLMRSGEVDRSLRAPLRTTYERLAPISEIALWDGAFRRVQLHRNTAFYRLLLEVCRLVALQILPEEKPGQYQFRDFTRDKKAMARLFERFVRNFYRREQSIYDVGYKRLRWGQTLGSDESMALLPVMETDVSLTRPDEHVIIDTKYYAEALRSRFDTERIHSGHLYQLFAYIRNVAIAEGAPAHVEGMLLYPAVKNHLQAEYEMHGHRVRVATVDLDQPWNAIQVELLRKVGIPAQPMGEPSTERAPAPGPPAPGRTPFSDR